MEKCRLAAEFFQKLGEGSAEFITEMIEDEMNAELVEIFNRFGAKIDMGDMDQGRFQTSLLIIGYLLRAHEETRIDLPRPHAVTAYH